MNRKTFPHFETDYFWDDDRGQIKASRSDVEWLSDYPSEISQIFTCKIRELRQEARTLRQALARKVRAINENETDEFAGWFAKEWLKVTDAEKIAELEAKVDHFRRLLSISADGPSDWERIVDEARKTPILDVVGSEFPLRRSGKTYVCKCPLHEERTPSFHVYPEQGTYHCFGCGAHGDSISFVMKRHNLNFKEAVKMLAGGQHE